MFECRELCFEHRQTRERDCFIDMTDHSDRNVTSMEAAMRQNMSPQWRVARVTTYEVVTRWIKPEEEFKAWMLANLNEGGVRIRNVGSDSNNKAYTTITNVTHRAPPADKFVIRVLTEEEAMLIELKWG